MCTSPAAFHSLLATHLPASPLRAALVRIYATAGEDPIRRGRAFYTLRSGLRVGIVGQPGMVGLATGVTADGWLEIQLDGEDRRDEWPPAQVALQPLAELAQVTAQPW